MVAPDSVAERERLLLMARKLLRFTTMLAVPAVGLGLWLWLGYGIGRGRQRLDARQAGGGGADAGLPPRLRRACCAASRPARTGAAIAGTAGSTKRRCCCCWRRWCWWWSSPSDGKRMAARKTSAWPLAQVYAALIVYASLYPFAGWRDQGIAPWAFLASPLAALLDRRSTSRPTSPAMRRWASCWRWRSRGGPVGPQPAPWAAVGVATAVGRAAVVRPGGAADLPARARAVQRRFRCSTRWARCSGAALAVALERAGRDGPLEPLPRALVRRAMRAARWCCWRCGRWRCCSRRPCRSGWGRCSSGWRRPWPTG